MLGWDISIIRQEAESELPALWESRRGEYLGGWRAHVHGWRWLDELEAHGQAIKLGGCGYPYRFTLTVAALLPIISSDDPSVLPPYTRDLYGGAFETLDTTWPLAREISKLPADEWLIIEIWDQS